MKIHNVKAPFFSREGQFGKEKKLCVGIAKQALKNYGKMRVFIGSNTVSYYDITFSKAQELYIRYKGNMIWKSRGKVVLIIPLDDFEHGLIKEAEATKESGITNFQDSLFDYDKDNDESK